MAYNELLAQRVERLLTVIHCHYEVKKMFGGLAFMINGKMACGIVKEELMVRITEDKYAATLLHPHARQMDFTGKPMKGFLYVSPEGMITDNDLAFFVKLGIEYINTKK